MLYRLIYSTRYFFTFYVYSEFEIQLYPFKPLSLWKKAINKPFPGQDTLGINIASKPNPLCYLGCANDVAYHDRNPGRNIDTKMDRSNLIPSTALSL